MYPREASVLEKIWFKLSEENSNNGIMIGMLKGPLDEARFRDSINKICDAIEAFSIRVIERDGTQFIELDQNLTPQISFIKRQGDEHWRDICDEELNRAISWRDFPLWRLVVLKGNDRSEVFIVSNHLVCDGMTGLFLFELFFSVYLGEAIPSHYLQALPDVTTMIRSSPFPINLINKARFTWGVRKRRKLEATLMPQDPTIPDNCPARTKLINFFLSKDEVLKIRSESKKHDSTIHGILCAALLFATQKHINPDRIPNLGLTTAADARPLMGKQYAQQLGNYAFTLDSFFEVGKQVDFWQLTHRILKDVANRVNPEQLEMTMKMIKPLVNAKIPIADFYRIHKANRRATLVITNVGRQDRRQDFGELKLLDCFHMSAVHCVPRAQLSLATASFCGPMRINFCYVSPHMADDLALAITNEFMTIMRSLDRL